MLFQRVQMAVRHVLDASAQSFDGAWGERRGDEASQPPVVGWIGDQNGRRFGGIEQLRVAPRRQALNDR
ncbi:Uncharacterised protein [Mycobacteroides abscessus subsp. massiliense]|nr:Uncharacterised protein [Mycobacteroides abscessus subsp. massiliense]